MTSLADQVVATLRRGIRDGVYVPGETYSVYQLAEAIGVSRSPVREAMVRLADAGLVEIARNRGFQVVLPQARDLAEIFAVRLALEVPAAGRLARAPHDPTDLLACLDTMQNAHDDEQFWAEDRRLHRLILTGAGNRRAARIVAELREVTSLLGEPTGRTHATICAEHRPIVEAIRTGDVPGAREAMRAHLTSTGLLLMAKVAGAAPEDPQTQAIWESATLTA